MSEEASLIGDSSMHTASEASPGGDFFRHRLTIRFSNGETMVYTVRDALHAEDIPSTVRFVVLTSYECESPDTCTELVLLNLNEIAFIKTEHVTNAELEREEAERLEADQRNNTKTPPRTLTHIGFI
jgi:hypothetical protein